MTDRDRPRRRTLRRLLVLLGLAVTAVFGYLAIRNAHLDEVVDALGELDAIWLVPAALLLAVCVVLRAERWRSLFAAGSRPPFGATLSALLAGYFFNAVLPLRPGEVVRVVLLKRRVGASAAEAGATVIVERAYDLTALLLLLFLAAPLLPDVTWLDAAAALAAVVGIGLAATIVVIAIWGERPALTLIRPLARFAPVTEERLEAIAHSAIAGLAGLRSPRVAAAAFGWTVLSWLVLVASCSALLAGFETGLSTGDVLLAGLLVVVATNLVLILPSSPGALGVFEAATVVALKAFGVDDSLALSYALVLHALNLLPYIAAGAFVLRGSFRRTPAEPSGDLG